MSDHKERRLLLCILALSTLVRLLAAVYLGNTTERAIDEYSYSALAARLATGHGYSFAENWYPFTLADRPTAQWSFAYTAFVAIIYALVGLHPLAVRLLQALLCGFLQPWLVYRLADRVFPGRPGVAMVAAACTAAYAFFVLYTAQIMTEAFYIVVLLWSLERALAMAGIGAHEGGIGKRDEAWRWKTAFTLGVSLGVATLLRQSVLPWAVVLFGWLLYVSLVTMVRWDSSALRRRVLGLVGVGVTMLGFIVPFTIRNHLVYGDFLLLNSNAGYAMYSAQHPLHGIDFQAFTAAPLPADLAKQELNEAEWDQELMWRGIGFVTADPVRYLKLSASRVLDFFEFWPTDTTRLHNAGRLLSFTLFLPFYVAGLWLAARLAWQETGNWRRVSTQPAGLLILFIFSYSLVHIFTWAMPRYRLPVDAVAMPFAALTISEWWTAVRRFFRDRRNSLELRSAKGGNCAESRL
jgi:hypothetical protein